MTDNHNIVIETLSDYIKIVSDYYTSLEEEYSPQDQNGYSSIRPRMLFRGQENYDWNLRPSLFRKEPKFDRDEFNWSDVQNGLIREFSSRANMYITSSNMHRFDWLALGQHNRLPTRLLDWTISPLVALYFACLPYKLPSECVDNKLVDDKYADGSVWLLETKNLSNIYDPCYDDNEPEEGFVFRPKVVSPFIESQLGWFSIHSYPSPEEEEYASQSTNEFQSISTENFSRRCKTWSELRKFRIPHENKKALLRELQIMGVDEAFIFPSIGGIARSLSRELRDKKGYIGE